MRPRSRSASCTVCALGAAERAPIPTTTGCSNLPTTRSSTILRPGVTFHKLTLEPFYYDAPAFQAHGWMRPNVHLTFSSAAPTRSVYEYTREAASVHGWTPTNIGPLGIAWSWQKTYPNGASASAHILTPDPRDQLDRSRDYQLDGSISLPS